MRAVIVGCGAIGSRVGALLVAHGHAVVGVRRRPPTDGPFPIFAGDAADALLYDRLGEPDALLVSANPGLRRGRDNGLALAAQLVCARFTRARLVYTSTTSVYADAGGCDIDEGGPLADDPAAAALIAIEQPFQTHANALVLRVAAIIGPTRTHALERLRAGDLRVHGGLERPFSFVHEDDLAEIVCSALLGSHGCGIANCAAPVRLSVGDYYRTLARRAGADPAAITGDGAPAPARRIMAPRFATRTWHGID